MNTTLSKERYSAVRQSSEGQRLTENQIISTSAIADILNGEIHRSGSFIETLQHYGFTFSRGERFDAQRAEIMIRKVYEARFGETMSTTRERLLERESILRDSGGEQALHYARSVLHKICDGKTMPYYKAQDEASVEMSRQHGVTENFSKKMMAQSFEAAEGRSLYEAGKALEEQYHRPVREAQRASQRSERTQYQRSGPSM
ncbi:hypothetical protein [Leisingera aquaemixtae]|uniref:Uncharacterized protein n=1 Tax=Leisingera aquaemixtae TaxID=1396826 RepID=A0A0P1HRQ8_9RHOB|nr:hypothetical protein [Leisingera aquaemixtae]CUI01864.1 hypothetical protein PHA8399_04013 [Leisingera aquaemixtae]